MKTIILPLSLLALPLLLGACSPDAPTIPCPLCYEDAWSREPFPGEAKQHIKPLTPEEVKAHGMPQPAPMPPEFLGVVQSTSGTEPW